MSRKPLLIIAAALLAGVGSARAQQYQGPEGLGAAVDINYYDTDFTVGSPSYDTHVTEIGFLLAQHFTPDFAVTFGAGYARLGMSDNAAAASFSPTGYYARAGARYDPALFSSNFGFSFRIAADYQRVNDSNKGVDLVDHWWSYAGAVGPWVRVGDVTFEGGIVYRHASGDQDLSGKLSSTEALGFAHSTNAYLGLTYHPNPDWTVALNLEGGGRKAAGVVFGYNFSSL
ncbi:MAG: hypothetical protein ACRES7_05290 [Gammaproteobacteria bacterium]